MDSRNLGSNIQIIGAQPDDAHTPGNILRLGGRLYLVGMGGQWQRINSVDDPTPVKRLSKRDKKAAKRARRT